MKKPWIGIHIFYAANQNPVVVEFIAPLIEELREHNLIQRYFFIKYWQEGPHVRLRLLPAEGIIQDEVKAYVEPKLTAYLEHKPALYDYDADMFADFHKELFLKEYSQEDWDRLYGEGGTMPVRANNRFYYFEYEPEYDRYGGVHGIELAEWHFEKSSDMVIKVLKDVNVHLRTILLGMSAQLTLTLCYGFLQTDQEVADFLDHYLRHWITTFAPNSEDNFPEYEKRYQKIAVELQERIANVRRFMVDGEIGNMTYLEHEWTSHVDELRRRVDALVSEGKLFFRGREEAPEELSAITKSEVVYYEILLSSYIHMTNNRLGASITDEIYVSFLLKRALEEMSALPKEYA